MKSEIRLLFVLKEVNDPGGGGWDLCELIREGNRWQTWNNITRWVEGIRALPEDLGWSSLETVDQTRRQNALASIAAMNLKKSPGGHTADSAALGEAAGVDRDRLRQQFDLYRPNLVICCGSETSDLFHATMDLGEVEWKRTNRGVWYHEPVRGQIIIAYSHPEARCAGHLLHYGLVDAVREIYSLSGQEGK
ncbi:hypothetical protein HFP89_08245 [Wenzhouxiangella sp. XN79A]|nr:hypothetical protein [Wenzhouxiangella sp. XN79A]